MLKNNIRSDLYKVYFSNVLEDIRLMAVAL